MSDTINQNGDITNNNISNTSRNLNQTRERNLEDEYPSDPNSTSCSGSPLSPYERWVQPISIYRCAIVSKELADIATQTSAQNISVSSSSSRSSDRTISKSARSGGSNSSSSSSERMISGDTGPLHSTGFDLSMNESIHRNSILDRNITTIHNQSNQATPEQNRAKSLSNISQDNDITVADNHVYASFSLVPSPEEGRRSFVHDGRTLDEVASNIFDESASASIFKNEPQIPIYEKDESAEGDALSSRSLTDDHIKIVSRMRTLSLSNKTKTTTPKKKKDKPYNFCDIREEHIIKEPSDRMAGSMSLRPSSKLHK